MPADHRGGLHHETLEMTMRYARQAPQHSAQAVERLSDSDEPAARDTGP
jgi:hypothetical protein